ncbi:MAG: hypothetical protein QOF48_3709 [Verrucomicrobiota bacterium]|jgi:photosystem II stability/assembly factor-like uncharacterized protein
MPKLACIARCFFAISIFVGSSLSAAAQWTNVTGNLAGIDSECGNLCLLSLVPGQDRIIAGIAKRGLWQTTDGGDHWAPLGQATDSDAIVNRPSRIFYDPANANIFWESGIYNGPGVYRTTNGGQSFQHLGNARHNDDVSVDLSDPRRRTLLAGSHEQSRSVWKSVDGGQTWTNIGTALPEGSKFSSNPLLVDAATYLVNSSGWGKGTGGIFRTINAGATWTQASHLEANDAPVVASDGSIYWPLMYDRGLVRSTDRGETWKQVCGPGQIKGSKIIELPGGKLAAVAGKTIKVSSDQGASWKPVMDPLPVPASGLIYSPARGSVFIWHWDCGNKVLTNAIWRHAFIP